LSKKDFSIFELTNKCFMLVIQYNSYLYDHISDIFVHFIFCYIHSFVFQNSLSPCSLKLKAHCNR